MRISLKSLIVVLLSLASTFSYLEAKAQTPTAADSADSENYRPFLGSKIAKTKYGEVSIRIQGYVRYLNQLGLDSSYTDAFGTTRPVQRRQDMQFQKVTVFFTGWFLNPKLRYVIFLWTNNASQGLGAQVVIAGNFAYVFNKNLTLAAGIMSLPGTRSVEGNFPLWLAVDNRMISDEYFRPSYTTGIRAFGEVVNKLTYNVMLGNNLSQLGVDAGQLDNKFNTFAGALVYCPTTGEYGMFNGAFGDFDNHQKAATRLGVHYTRSDEDRQGQPSNNYFENVQIRLSDGSIIFAHNLFDANSQIDNARYQMSCFDGGVKYKGFALEGEYYMRQVDNFKVTGTPLTFDKLTDTGYQLLGSAMILPKLLQGYATYAKINGEYGNPSEWRVGLNFFPFKNNYCRLNAQYIMLDKSPVGGTAYPYAVGGNGNIFNLDFEIVF